MKKELKMWELQSESANKRIYFNQATGSRSTQTQIKVDKDKNSWWQFDNLMELPYTRNFQAAKISSLYALGLSRDDLHNHIGRLRKILKSTDPEKYEQAYAEVLDFETKVNSATDAIKQMSALVCVYFTLNDEAIDGWDAQLQIKKMALLEADVEMHSFFLTKQIEITERYTQSLNLLSQIVSPQENGKS